MNVNQLIGKPPSALAHFLNTLSTGTSPAPDVKSYSDIVYFNYSTLGISFQFSPRNGTSEQLRDNDLQLEAVDVYNAPSVNAPARSTEPAFSAYPRLPIELHLAGTTPAVITIAKDTTGREFVGWLGEPTRKGGGTGPSSGSIHIWCEWSQHGIMVEFGGNDARGPQAWERGGDAVWRVVTVFVPKSKSTDE
ncbi:hypothetical protein OG21DRAFT_1473690 [Imleria badia]|nr:hypothetical protein OG21DRAFT_1473690 [Imleria badia]